MEVHSIWNACGDIIDTRTQEFYGSMTYLNALEIVRLLNQRWRWLKEGSTRAA